MYVLDTDHISIVQHRDDPLCDLILSEAAKVGEDDLFTTVISFQEQALGWHNRLARAKTKKDVVFGYRRFETMLIFLQERACFPLAKQPPTALRNYTRRELASVSWICALPPSSSPIK